MASKFVQKCVSVYNSLNKNDFIRGLVIACLTAAIATIGQTLELGHWPERAQWILAGKSAFAAGVSYLLYKYKSGPKEQKDLKDA